MTNQTIIGNLTVTGTLTGATVTGAKSGIHSGGNVIGVAELNFIGTGNTFAMDGETVDISIAGGGGGGLVLLLIMLMGQKLPLVILMRHNSIINLMLDVTKAGASNSYIVSVIPNITVNSGVAVQ